MKPQSSESAAQRIATAPEQYRSLVAGGAPRFAVVRGGRSVGEVMAYVPANYFLLESFEVEREGRKPALVIIIGGHDNAGWTLDGYIIPRLASGLLTCEEITEPADKPAPALPAAGTRVKLLHDVERYPHFIAPAGATGSVVDVGDESVFAIRLDMPIAGADDWDNEAHWYLANGDDPTGAYEVIADDFVNHDALRAASPTDLLEIVKAGGPTALIEAATALLDVQYPVRAATLVLRYRPIVENVNEVETAEHLWQDALSRLADEIAERQGCEVDLHFEDMTS